MITGRLNHGYLAAHFGLDLNDQATINTVMEYVESEKETRFNPLEASASFRTGMTYSSQPEECSAKETSERDIDREFPT